MADQTLNPTSNTSPDPGQGGGAVTLPTNTGHGSTTSASSDVGGVIKTCLWTTFQTPLASPSAITLKVGWSQNGSLSDGGLLTSNDFTIEYSLSGGVGWSILHSAGQIQSFSSGTDQVTLSPTQDISQVRVRDSISAFGDAGPPVETGSVTASVSSIRLEVDFGGNRIVLGMM